MKEKLTGYWQKVISIGHAPGMDIQREVRLHTLNALAVIALALILFFIVVNILLGTYSVFRSLFITPFLFLVVYCNYKRKYTLASHMVSYAMLLLILFLAVTQRRTGTEYILIAIGCCSVMFYESKKSILAASIFAFCCYLFYKWYDYTHEFQPNPSIPYTFAQNFLMFISGMLVVAQSLVFKSIIQHYAINMKRASDEVAAMNEELNASNEELQAFSENLDMMVRQKSGELQAYIDGIDISIYATVSDLQGKFIKVNGQVLSASGYTHDELLNQHYSILGSGNHPEEFFQERRRVLMEGKAWRGEVEHKTKTGTLLWFDCVVIPIRDANGEFRQFLTLGLPITERKMHDQLQDETLRFLESIAFRASHKIRGPLARIKGLSSLVRNKNVDPEEFGLIADKMLISSDELEAATSELVDYVYDHQERIKQ